MQPLAACTVLAALAIRAGQSAGPQTAGKQPCTVVLLHFQVDTAFR